MNFRERLKTLECQRSTGQSMRVLIRGVCGPANLATSTCTRSLSENGHLTEIIHLDGGREGLSDEDLDRFVENFPVERSCQLVQDVRSTAEELAMKLVRRVSKLETCNALTHPPRSRRTGGR